MRHFRKIIIISLAILLATTVGMSLSFAGTGSIEPPPGQETPYLKPFQSNAGGTRLYGVITIEYRTAYYDETLERCQQPIRPPCCGTIWEVFGSIECFNSRVYLQLNHGNVTKTFYEELVLPGHLKTQVEVIKETMRPAILTEFFGGDNAYQIEVLFLGEERHPKCANLDCPNCTDALDDCHVEYVTLDVVISVQK